MLNSSSSLISPSPLSPKLRSLEYSFEQSIPKKRQSQELDIPLRRKRRASSHSSLAQTAVGLRELAKKIGKAQLQWEQDPKKVLIVCKLTDSLFELAINSASWLIEMGMTVYIQKDLIQTHAAEQPQVDDPSVSDSDGNVESRLQFWDKDFGNTAEAEQIDFVITFGGDGTVLYAAWLFQKKVPPIIPFNLGSLGFMTVFAPELFKPTITHILQAKGVRMNFRMRFTCKIIRKNVDECDHLCTYQVLNDVVIDRGPSPYLSQLELFGNDSHITTVQADGLVIASPTGSTAYSLSAGGSLVHPQVSAILVTPICPHTLSFRPMILPDTMDVKIFLPKESRATAWVSFDGRHRVQLNAGDAVQVVTSSFPVPTICKEEQSVDWFNGLERCLAWNKRERQKESSIFN